MTYALRNTLILAGLFAAVTVGGSVWVFGPVRGAFEEVEGEKREVSEEIAAMGDVAGMKTLITQNLEDAQERWDHLYKVIPPADDPGNTWEHLNDIMSRRDSGVRFAFRFQEKGGDDILGWNKYAISDGRGTYGQLYGFLWRLENQRRLYRVEDLLVEEVPVTDEETGLVRSRVRFSMQLLAYQMPGTEPPEGDQEFLRLGGLARNPFRPLIQIEVPPNTENLVEVDKSELLGIQGKTVVLVRDQHGDTRTIHLGDRVYLGTLVEVDPIRGRAMFKLNKAGIADYVTLGLSGPAETGEGD